MKILLVTPSNDKEIRKTVRRFFSNYRSTLPYLASLVPVDADIEIIDESIHGTVNLEDLVNKEFDLVGISPQTASAPRGYEIASKLREADSTIIMGGVHITKMPLEALNYADAIVIGEAEGQWEKIIVDHLVGKFKKELDLQDRIYQNKEQFSMQNMPVPRWDLIKKGFNYLKTVELTRGCPYNCSFCSIHDIYGKKFRFKPVEDVISEIEKLNSKNIIFATDNLSVNKHYAKALFKALIPLNIKWVAQASIDFAPDDEFLKLAYTSGCKGLVIGFESVEKRNMGLSNKDINTRFDYYDAVAKIHDHGIPVGGSFIFGFDEDYPGIANKTLEFVNKAKIDAISPHILTPYPGTLDFTRLKDEGRLYYKGFPNDWRRYDTKQVVFEPRRMSAENLQEEYDSFRGGCF